MITFKLGDKRDPRQWPAYKKWRILLVTLMLQLWANAISAMYEPGVEGVAHEFGVSETVARLPQAVFLYGFAAGPVFAAPLSEDYGRLPVHVASVGMMGLMQIPCALAPNMAALIVSRFFAGAFAAATFNSVGMVSDMWTPDEQGWGVNAFALFAELGATTAATWSGYLYLALGWRWIFGVCGLGTALLLALFVLTVPETRAGVLLERRARRLRLRTGDARWYSAHERVRSSRTPASWAREVLIRPLFMLFTEPIVWSFALFDGYNYAIIYLALEAIPLVYAEHGFSIGQQGLPFIALSLGFLLAFVAFPIQQALYRRAGRKNPTGEAPPEAHLLWGLFASAFFPASLFWFAWTSQASVHWIVSMLALVVFATTSHIIFLIVSEFTVKSYSLYSSSAVAAQSFVREILSGSVTLFSTPMYRGLGYRWASTLLAFVALPLAAVPWILHLHGPRIRARSAFAGEIALAEAEAKRERIEQAATQRLEPKAEAQSQPARSSVQHERIPGA
ncbi:MFS general substrate transporter [Tilletiaria anomala UBC 951]|uniref:MFS general substrate transporter n=1 Tax=Tilletiaria anomala (strain ATCC 24038 / CBS 436.72 / UBC 951) TaxID=1037660 RepID=A0A066WIN2_TILAU|nr:MFS general substrate transporter [Tilletiaria anomala UBC 951]KDN52393.1 MFS general substrate transporter [Tilletiaria anomala UBC 951]